MDSSHFGDFELAVGRVKSFLGFGLKEAASAPCVLRGQIGQVRLDSQMSHRVEIPHHGPSQWRQLKGVHQSCVQVLGRDLKRLIEAVCEEERSLLVRHVGGPIVRLRQCASTFQSSGRRCAPLDRLLGWQRARKSILIEIELVVDLDVHLHADLGDGVVDAAEKDVAQALQGYEVDEKGKPQELLAGIPELVASAEFEVVLEAQLLVDRILVKALVLVQLLDLAHEPELVSGAKCTLVVCVLTVQPHGAGLLVLVHFILLVNFGPECIQNLIDAPFEEIAGFVARLPDCILHELTDEHLALLKIDEGERVARDLLQVEHPQLLKVLAISSMLEQYLAEDGIGNEELGF